MSQVITLQLPPRDSLIRSCEVDPLPYYYRPVVGFAYRARTNLGLRHLPRHCDRLLDVGYGSGLLMPTLATVARELHGVDIHPQSEAVTSALSKLGIQAQLKQADGRHLPYSQDYFDVVISFSMLDYVQPVGAYVDEMLRVVKPGGRIILGVPQANSLFNYLYTLVGFSRSRVDDLHVTSPADLRAHLANKHHRWTESGFPRWLPQVFSLYKVFEIQK